MKTKNKPVKTSIINLFLLPALIAGLGLIPAGRVTAQTFTTLYNFPHSSLNAPIDPNALILSGDTLYGTTTSSLDGPGTVFAVNTDGTGFATLYNFTGGLDGMAPGGGLILSGNTLYGTTADGGGYGNGTVFKINTDGTGITILYRFTATPYPATTNSDGAQPHSGVILSGNTLYGTASRGGSAGNGTVFAVNTDGTGFTILHTFTASPPYPNFTNSDGASPACRLILSGNTLYGTAGGAGSLGHGTLFAVNTDGTGFTNLHTFTGGSDGAFPLVGLVLSGNTLYGGAGGGGSGSGTLFAVNTDGTGFTTLHSFTAAPPYPNNANSDGVGPRVAILSGNTLYGWAATGGSSGSGTVFAVNTNGTGFTTLHSFTAPKSNGSYDSTNSDGAVPVAGVILSGNTLYGTTWQGGSSGEGTVFSLSLGPASAPQLTIIPSGANVILTWPTNVAGFTLQSTTNLVSPAVWTTVSPGPVVVNGVNAVSNPISAKQNFYRLSQ
jgi:uncharacterized repeat protein (TIGR03803 family)